MESRQLRYFVAVAEHRHFTKAAAALYIAQPALSQQIKALEAELGVVLFDRSGHRVRLTTPGEALLQRAQSILRALTDAEQEVREYASLTRGRLVIGTIPAQTLGPVDLPEILALFHRRYPGIELRLEEGLTVDLLPRLQAGTLDLALAIQTEAPLLADIIACPLIQETLEVLVSQHHPAAARVSLAMADVIDEPFVFFKYGSPIRAATLEQARRHGKQLTIAFETNEVSTLQALVAKNLCVAVVPHSLTVHPHLPIIGIPVSDLPLQRTVSLMWSAQHFLSRPARAFRDVLLAHYAVEQAETTSGES